VKRAATVLRRTAGAGASVVLAGLSWHVLAGLAAVVLIVVGSVCWVITDPGRSQRLAMLIEAWRGSSRQKATRSPWTGRSRRPWSACPRRILWS